MKTSNKANFLNGVLIVVCLGAALSCSTFKNLTGGSNESVPNTVPNAGQKLSGHYEHGVPSEIYTFDENGTYTHEDAYPDPNSKVKNKESGTYRVDGKEIIFQANGKSVSKDILVLKTDVGKTSPQKIDLDFTTYDLVSAEKLASRKKDSSDSTSTTSTDADAAMPDKFEGFTRTGKTITLENSSNSFLVSGCSDVPKYKIVTLSDYKAANGELVSFHKQIYSSPDDAKKNLECWLKLDADYDTTLPKEDIASDLLRYQVAERVPTKNGGELLVMKTFPRYPPADKAYWIDGSIFYMWIDSNEDKRPHKDHQTIAFAKAYVQQ